METIRHDDGRWLSGPGGPSDPASPEPHTPDPRPVYPPDLVVRVILDQLATDGIDIRPPTAGQRRLAAMRAAALLEALNVKPEEGL